MDNIDTGNIGHTTHRTKTILSFLACLRPVCCVPNVTSVCIIHSWLSSSCVLCAQCYQCLYYSFLIVFVLYVVCQMLPEAILYILDCLRHVCCVLNVTIAYIIHSWLSSSCVLCAQCYQCLYYPFLIVWQSRMDNTDTGNIGHTTYRTKTIKNGQYRHW
jgi:hypothetical protein